MEELNPYYITGFVDGEGCFHLNYRSEIKGTRKGTPRYYRWKVGFSIFLKKDDKEVLQKIKNTLKCGNIYESGGWVRYDVGEVENLFNIITQFFRKYQLVGKKKKDFELWAEAVEIIYKNRQTIPKFEKGKRGFAKAEWDKQELQRLLEIQTEMKKYKAETNKEPRWRHEAENKSI